MSHPVHPETLRRYLRVRRLHRAVGCPGDETARTQLRAVDPRGLLSLGLEIGEERAAGILRDHHHEPGETECD